MARYRIGKTLGAGGMAEVVEAWQQNPDGTETLVALKRVLPTYRADLTALYRFEQEARIGLALTERHAAFGRVLRLERDAHDCPLLVLERIDGTNLIPFAEDTLAVPVIRAILVAVLEALAIAHSYGVVHRDIAPGNIMLSTSGEVKLVDLGLARLMQEPRSMHGFIGTLAYASPELVEGESVGPSADLYSLAAVVYELLTGQPPFGLGELPQMQHRMRMWRLEPLPSSVPKDLRAVISGLLARVEERRYQSAAEVLAVLREHGEPIADAADIAALVQQRAAQGKELLTRTPTHVPEPLEPVERPLAAQDSQKHTRRRAPLRRPLRRRSATWMALAGGMAVVLGLSGGLHALWDRDGRAPRLAGEHVAPRATENYAPAEQEPTPVRGADAPESPGMPVPGPAQFGEGNAGEPGKQSIVDSSRPAPAPGEPAHAREPARRVSPAESDTVSVRERRARRPSSASRAARPGIALDASWTHRAEN